MKFLLLFCIFILLNNTSASILYKLYKFHRILIQNDSCIVMTGNILFENKKCILCFDHEISLQDPLLRILRGRTHLPDLVPQKETSVKIVTIPNALEEKHKKASRTFSSPPKLKIDPPMRRNKPGHVRSHKQSLPMPPAETPFKQSSLKDDKEMMNCYSVEYRGLPIRLVRLKENVVSLLINKNDFSLEIPKTDIEAVDTSKEFYITHHYEIPHTSINLDILNLEKLKAQIGANLDFNDTTHLTNVHSIGFTKDFKEFYIDRLVSASEDNIDIPINPSKAIAETNVGEQHVIIEDILDKECQKLKPLNEEPTKERYFSLYYQPISESVVYKRYYFNIENHAFKNISIIKLKGFTNSYYFLMQLDVTCDKEYLNCESFKIYNIEVSNEIREILDSEDTHNTLRDKTTFYYFLQTQPTKKIASFK
jgi:hypothetical protein